MKYKIYAAIPGNNVKSLWWEGDSYKTACERLNQFIAEEGKHHNFELHDSVGVYAGHEATEKVEEKVNHPAHYTQHPSGVECIDIAEHYGFNIGNCIKYIWRAGLKGDAIEDLKKARWYLDREISKREKTNG